jgi:hypothetical protein
VWVDADVRNAKATRLLAGVHFSVDENSDLVIDGDEGQAAAGRHG